MSESQTLNVLGEGNSSTESPYDIIRKSLDGLSSEHTSVRMRVAARVAKALDGADMSSVMDEFDDEPFALLGWFEYCIKNTISLPIAKVVHTFVYNLSVYSARRGILTQARSDQGVEIEEDLERLEQRLSEFITLIGSSSNPLLSYHAYIFQAKLLFARGSFRLLRQYLESDLDRMQSDHELYKLYADACMRLGEKEKVLELYPQIHYREQSIHYIEEQISTLIQLGREAEAKTLYDFSRDISDATGKKLKPFIYYRGTVESDNDLRDLPLSLIDLYAGENFGDRELRIMKSADEYISREIDRIEASLKIADTRGEYTLAEEFKRMQMRRFFLYETATLVLYQVHQADKRKASRARSYVRLLDIFVAEYSIDKENSVLSAYMDKHSHDWLDIVRELQHEAPGEEYDDTPGSMGEKNTDITSEVVSRNNIDGQENGSLIPLHRVANIIDFLYDRIENEDDESQHTLKTLRRLQDTIARETDTIGFFDDEDTIESGVYLGRCLNTLSREELSFYSRLSRHVIKKYGYTARQLIAFFSLNSHVLQDMPLKGIKNDPKLIVFSLIVTLLGDQYPNTLRIRDLTTHPALELLSRREMLFLTSILYREGFYAELIECLIDNPRFLIHPEQIELIVLSLSYLGEIEALDFMESLEGECLSDRYGTKNLSEHIEMLRENIHQRDARGEEHRDRLDHAEMWYDYLSDDEGGSADVHEFQAIHTPISALAASHWFSVVRMVSHPATSTEKKKHIDFLRSIYPYAKLEKREILLHILMLAFEAEDTTILIECIKKAKDDSISIGKWKYAPLLLDTTQEDYALDEIAKDNSPEETPGAMMYRLHKLSYRSGKDSPEQDRKKFQLTYIFARQNGDVFEMFDALKKHVQHIFTILSFATDNDGNISEDGAGESIVYFDSIGRDPIELDDEDEFFQVGEKQVLLSHYLVRHIRILKKFLDTTIETEVDPEDMETQEFIKKSWSSILDEFERIFQLFPSDTGIMLMAQNMMKDLRRECENLFSTHEESRETKEERAIYFSNTPLPESAG